MNEVIYFNENQFDKDKQVLYEAQAAFQSLFDSVNETEALSISSIKELETIASKGENGFKDLLEKAMEPPKLAGIPLKKRQAIELMDLPDLTNLNKSAANARDFLRFSNKLEVKENKIEIAQGAMKAIEKANSILADTEDMQKLFEAHKAAQKALQDLQDTALKSGKPLFVRSKYEGVNNRIQDFFTFREGKIEIEPGIYMELKNKA